MNSFPQIEQLYGRFPVWLLMCDRRSVAVVYDFEHKSHLNGLLPEWLNCKKIKEYHKKSHDVREKDEGATINLS